MCVLDLVGYTQLTEEQGDDAAAEIAANLAEVTQRAARARGGLPVKWLGDGVMFFFRRPVAAVLSALAMVQDAPAAGLPPAHVGIQPGRSWCSVPWPSAGHPAHESGSATGPLGRPLLRGGGERRVDRISDLRVCRDSGGFST
jgi:hypothetical protein